MYICKKENYIPRPEVDRQFEIHALDNHFAPQDSIHTSPPPFSLSQIP